MLCREEAYDLCALLRAKRGSLVERLPNVIGVVKEEEDEAKTLGVQEFAEHYFCGPLYLDSERRLYEALGNRKLSLATLGRLVLNPLTSYREMKAASARYKAKGGVAGNYKGEGLVQGGVIVVSPAGKVVYTYLEATGSQLPVDEIEKAIDSLSTADKAEL